MIATLNFVGNDEKIKAQIMDTSNTGIKFVYIQFERGGSILLSQRMAEDLRKVLNDLPIQV